MGVGAFLQRNRYLVFLVVYLARGRLAPAFGVWSRLPLWFFFPVAVGADCLQICGFWFLYSRLGHTKLFRKVDVETVRKRRFFRLAQKYGHDVVILVSAFPLMGGGIWTSVLLGSILGMSFGKVFLYSATGSVLGNAVIYALACMVLR